MRNPPEDCNLRNTTERNIFEQARKSSAALWTFISMLFVQVPEWYGIFDLSRSYWKRVSLGSHFENEDNLVQTENFLPVSLLCRILMKSSVFQQVLIDLWNSNLYQIGAHLRFPARDPERTMRLYIKQASLLSHGAEDRIYRPARQSSSS